MLVVVVVACGSQEPTSAVAVTEAPPLATATPTTVEVPTTTPLDPASQPTPEPTSAGFPELPSSTPVPSPTARPETDVELGDGVSSDDLADEDDPDGDLQLDETDSGDSVAAQTSNETDEAGVAADGESPDDSAGADASPVPEEPQSGGDADIVAPEPTATLVPARSELAGEALATAVSNGAEVYHVTCVRCHAPDGVGSFMGPRLLAVSTSYTQVTLEQELAYGHPVTFGFADKLSPEEIEAVAAYVRATL